MGVSCEELMDNANVFFSYVEKGKDYEEVGVGSEVVAVRTLLVVKFPLALEEDF